MRSIGWGYPNDPKIPPTDPLNWEGEADLLPPLCPKGGAAMKKGTRHLPRPLCARSPLRDLEQR